MYVVPGGCRDGDDEYLHEDIVPDADPCKLCQCVNGEIICATQECESVTDENCRALPPAEGACCPTYECQDAKPSIPSEVAEVIPEDAEVAEESSVQIGDAGEVIDQDEIQEDDAEHIGEGEGEATDTEAPKNCTEGPNEYLHGEDMTRNPCSPCQCNNGEIVCASVDCPSPPSDNCNTVGPAEGQCCPTYECEDPEPTSPPKIEDIPEATVSSLTETDDAPAELTTTTGALESVTATSIPTTTMSDFETATETTSASQTTEGATSEIPTTISQEVTTGATDTNTSVMDTTDPESTRPIPTTTDTETTYESTTPSQTDGDSTASEIPTTTSVATLRPPVTRPPGGCVTVNGRFVSWYAEGEIVEKEDPCEHCSCKAGIISCWNEPCIGSGIIEGETDNCVALDPEPGECCPKEYKCSE